MREWLKRRTKRHFMIAAAVLLLLGLLAYYAPCRVSAEQCRYCGADRLVRSRFGIRYSVIDHESSLTRWILQHTGPCREHDFVYVCSPASSDFFSDIGTSDSVVTIFGAISILRRDHEDRALDYLRRYHALLAENLSSSEFRERYEPLEQEARREVRELIKPKPKRRR